MRGYTLGALLLVAGWSCGSEEAPVEKIPMFEPSARGSAPVGHEVFTLTDGARGRTLTVQAWYPADEGARGAAEAGVELPELVSEGPRRDALAALVAAAPPLCTTRRTRSAAGAKPAGGAAWPLVIFSHCHGCLRFSALSVAERLASHGIAVLAADHVDGTLFDQLDGKLVGVNAEFLNVRAADVSFVLSSALDGGNAEVPAALRGRFDGARVGVMGHSYGAATVGKVLQDDDRVKAGFAMAAPVAFLGDVRMERIAEPLFLLLAREDNSIGKFGNLAIEDDFSQAASPAWLASVQDAGHWSFSDLCGLPGFAPGCGTGKRQEDKSEFTYLDIDQGRELATSYATAFFGWALLGHETGKTYLGEAHPDGVVTIAQR